MASQYRTHRVINGIFSDGSRMKMIVRSLEVITAAYECELRVSYLIHNKHDPDEIHDFGCAAFELRRLGAGQVEGLENVVEWLESRCIFDDGYTFDPRHICPFVGHVGVSLEMWPRASVILATMVVDDVDIDELKVKPASKGAVEALEKVGVDDGECPICLEEFSLRIEAAKMPCSHTFHRDCIVGWLKRGSACPMCQFQIPSESDVDGGQGS